MFKPGSKRMFIQSFVCQKDKAIATPSAFAWTEENRRWDEFYYQLIYALLCFVVLFVQLEVMRWKYRLFINWLQRKTERAWAIVHRRINFTNVHQKLCQYSCLWQTVVQHTQYLNTSLRSANQRKLALCRKQCVRLSISPNMTKSLVKSASQLEPMLKNRCGITWFLKRISLRNIAL